MGIDELAAARLPRTGDWLLTPPLGATGARVVLEGVFTFQYSGMRFDPRYRTGTSGGFTLRHPYLQWRPRPPLLESDSVDRHRYQFRFPAEWKLQEQSIGLRLDLDRLVDEFLIPPSEVRAALSGEMVLRVRPLPGAPASLWPEVLGASVPAALLIGGVGWVLRRRMALAGMPVQLQEQLGRILRKQRSALAAASDGPPHHRRLAEELQAIPAGAWAVARRIRSLRDARARIDQPALTVQVLCLAHELAGAPDPTARGAGEAALAEKRKVLSLLEQIQGQEAHCAMLLASLEATLDTACLILRQVEPAGPAAAPLERVRRDLQAEIAAISEQELADREERGC